MDLNEALDRVDGPDSFLDFAKRLLADRLGEVGKTIEPYGAGPNGWENGTIEDYLEAAIAWGVDTKMGATLEIDDASPWKRCALFLMGGKIYE